MKQHGLAAQCRRRNDTGFSSGVTINQIRQDLLEMFKDYMSISQNLLSEDFSRHLTNPKMQLRGRVGTKCNSHRELHIDAHYLFAHNKFHREFVPMFPRSASISSTDDMAKIKVGPPEVS